VKVERQIFTSRLYVDFAQEVNKRLKDGWKLSCPIYTTERQLSKSLGGEIESAYWAEFEKPVELPEPTKD
jgi:hypothetical protein